MILAITAGLTGLPSSSSVILPVAPMNPFVDASAFRTATLVFGAAAKTAAKIIRAESYPRASNGPGVRPAYFPNFSTNAAAALDGSSAVKCVTKNLEVPAESEFVLEGRLVKEVDSEGPFVDLTETRDFERKEPVFVVDCLTHRKVLTQHRFDLSQLDPEASDLNLIIQATQKLNIAVR